MGSWWTDWLGVGLSHLPFLRDCCLQPFKGLPFLLFEVKGLDQGLSITSGGYVLCPRQLP